VNNIRSRPHGADRGAALIVCSLMLCWRLTS
jgi:hypothetical protein